MTKFEELCEVAAATQKNWFHVHNSGMQSMVRLLQGLESTA